MYKGTRTTMTSDSSLEIIKVRSQQMNIFKEVKWKKTRQTRILYPVKISLKNKSIIKASRHTKGERIYDLIICITGNTKGYPLFFKKRILFTYF